MDETLTVARLKALRKHWETYPPLPIMVATYMGYKPPEKGTQDDLVNMLAGLGHSVKFETEKRNGSQ